MVGEVGGGGQGGRYLGTISEYFAEGWVQLKVFAHYCVLVLYLVSFLFLQLSHKRYVCANK